MPLRWASLGPPLGAQLGHVKGPGLDGIFRIPWGDANQPHFTGNLRPGLGHELSDSNSTDGRDGVGVEVALRRELRLPRFPIGKVAPVFMDGFLDGGIVAIAEARRRLSAQDKKAWASTATAMMRAPR